MILMENSKLNVENVNEALLNDALKELANVEYSSWDRGCRLSPSLKK